MQQEAARAVGGHVGGAVREGRPRHRVAQAAGLRVDGVRVEVAVARDEHKAAVRSDAESAAGRRAGGVQCEPTPWAAVVDGDALIGLHVQHLQRHVCCGAQTRRECDR